MDTNPRHIALSLAQLKALLAHAREGTPPNDMDGRTQGALQRAADRLNAELTRRPTPEFMNTLTDLEEALCDVMRAPFVTVIHRRLRDLLAVVRLWCAAEMLPNSVREDLLKVEDIDSLAWAAEVIDHAEAANVDIPGMGARGER